MRQHTDTEDLQDAEDARAAAAARREMNETGECPVPWHVVKEELGLID